MDAPEEIIIPFEYMDNVKTSYHTLELPDYHIDRVALSSILDVIQGLQSYEEELKKTSVSYWVPSRHGWDLEWRVSAQEFIDRHKLQQITKRA